MVDQVSKKVVTIPMCLHDQDTSSMMFYTICSLSCMLMFCSLKGFPPPDRILCNWLLTLNGLTDRNLVMKNLHVLLYSLFAVTNKHLAVLLAELSHSTTHILELPKLTKEDIRKLPESKQAELISLTKSRQESLAVAFHDQMAQGQSVEAPNKYRKHFFEEVVDAARKVSISKGSTFCLNDPFLQVYKW